MIKKSKIQADLWGKSPKGWAEIQERQHEPLWEAMLKSTNVGEGTTLLDAGCGEGYNTRLLAKKGAKVFGVDISKRMIELA